MTRAKAKPTAPEIKGLHVNRPSSGNAAKKTTKSKKAADKDANYNRYLLPGLVKERHQMFADRVKAKSARFELLSPTRIGNYTTTGTYRTGDGEVPFIVRPGSMVAFGLPSRGDRT